VAEQLLIDRSKTAVLIMDYQNPQLNYFPENVQSELLVKANKVLAKARQEGITVIYLRDHEDGTIHSAVTPPAGETVLTKSRSGSFSTTNLDDVLKKQGKETLVLMGFRTKGCVLSTSRWATDIDYKVLVLSDCCGDPDEELHHVLMEKVLPWQTAIVTSSAEFLQALG